MLGRLVRWHPALLSVGLLGVGLMAAATYGGGAAGSCDSGVLVSAVSGSTVTGSVSTFGPPLEPAGATASGNPGGDAAPGVSLHLAGTHFSDPANRALLGRWFLVTIGGHRAVLQDIDLGPADYLNRAIDVTGAGAAQMGLDPRSFPTGSAGSAAPAAAPGGRGCRLSYVPVAAACSINAVRVLL